MLLGGLLVRTPSERRPCTKERTALPAGQEPPGSGGLVDARTPPRTPLLDAYALQSGARAHQRARRPCDLGGSPLGGDGLV